MLPATSPRKKPKSPGADAVLNPKTSVTCSNVPEGLFEANAAKKHFSKFGRILRIRLLPKRHSCIIEYDQPMSAERALLNAGAFDGFMFDVTRSKPRTRKKSKREDDPDWVPDSDVEEELSAMSGGSGYRVPRQKPMDVVSEVTKPKTFVKHVKQSPVRKKAPVREKPPVMSQSTSGKDSPLLVMTTHTTLSIFEAAAELHQLRSKISLTPDEQWRILDARDRILRAWGGAGSRVKVGGATIGTCQDMCPEKELLHRQAEHQVMTLETVVDSDGLLEPWRAVKQYSRSSADQEMPMCYELRPASVLMRTCSYLLYEIADTARQVTLSDWFHFMWDRFRSIRKDITQQALCCAESIRLLEMCARFHAHCAARLADLEHTQFDQKLNTDNLTKCLQTLKHMYADVTPDKRPREVEFRGYIALLNLGDANFWWEIKQLPHELQKAEPIVFAIQVFNALDNNNYVRFFRLVQQKATYLQACILLRYFNDVRARALARIVKAYAPRGGSRYPALDLMGSLAFESIENMKSFINHYGLRFGRIEEHELSIILSRHQFIEDSDPFPVARAVYLIESKRQCSVGEVIAGGPLPDPDYSRHVLHSSFTKDGKLKESSLVAEEQGFNTINDSNKDVKALKAEIQRLAQGGRSYANTDVESKGNLFVKPEAKTNPRYKAPLFTAPTSAVDADKKLFSFKPAIMVESTDVMKNSPEKVFGMDTKNVFSFSKPQESAGVTRKDSSNIFAPATRTLFENKSSGPKSLFENNPSGPSSLFENKPLGSTNLFGNNPSGPKSLFENKPLGSTNLFENKPSGHKSLFENKPLGSTNLFENKSSGPKSLFENNPSGPKSLFENKPLGSTNLFENKSSGPKSLFENNPSGPKSLFENKPLGSTNLFENKPSGPKSLFENKPLGSTSLFENKPSGPKSLFENKPSGPTSLFENNSQAPKGLFQNVVAQSPKNVFNNKAQEANNLFKNDAQESKSLFENKDPKNLFEQTFNNKKDPFQSAQNVFKTAKSDESLFSKPDVTKSIFGQNIDVIQPNISKNVFGNIPSTSNNNVVGQATFNSKNIFAGAKEKSIFAKPNDTPKVDSIFVKPNQETQEASQTKLFGAFNNKPESNNIFGKPDTDTQKIAQSIFAPNGETNTNKVSPGNLFKNVLNPANSDVKSYSIFQSKNIAPTAGSMSSENAATNNIIYDFNPNKEAEQQQQMALQNLNEAKLREEDRQLQQQRQEEEKRQIEARRHEELRRQEEVRRQEELRRQEEIRRQEENQRQQNELRLLEEQRRREEQRKQDELRKRLEEERKAELKRLAEEKEREFKEAVEKESTQLVEELIKEISNETSVGIIREEQENLRLLTNFANDISNGIVTELCNEICFSEMKGEIFLTFKIMRKWFYVWRKQVYRNLKRRKLLEDTPVWLPERTPIEEAFHIRRMVEDAALKNMNDFHNGYKFSGELKQLPSPQPYSLMELIKSPLLKRMKQISYSYDKCFFWKVTLVAPGEDKWLCRKINVQKWLLDAFSDKKKHEESETLIHVGKESWNHLMDFAISVSLVNADKMANCAEAMEGTNGFLFYSTEKDNNLTDKIHQTLLLKYPYQVVPVAVIMAKMENTSSYRAVQNLLTSYVERKLISAFKVFILEPQNINELLDASTKRALRWLAKKYPQTPPLEIDFLKSICQRYLGNEIWCRFRTERDGRMNDVLKDIQKLIRCYNAAVDKLACVITNEDLFNHTSFPLEFKRYLDHTSLFPKSYEFIPSNVRSSENISTIKNILKQLKLPTPPTGFNPLSVVGMQQQIRKYCYQIGWFEKPEEIVCKVVAVMPNELSDVNMSREDFAQYFSHYDLVDFLNIIVYEKINRLNRFNNCFAIYEKSVLDEYRNIHWLYEVDALAQTKPKPIKHDDELDHFIEAKRRKKAMDSLEYLVLEERDSTLVEENIKEADASINKYNDYTKAVKQLEKEIEEGKKKSVEFENMLRAALQDA